MIASDAKEALMIVRRLDDGSLMMIAQSDHSKLSGAFAAHWGNANFEAPRPRESVVRAAALHDCGWYRYETAPRYDAVAKSSPSFFQVPNDDEQLTAFAAGIDWLTGIDAYAGLLISRHRTGLWRGRYGAVKQPLSINRGFSDEKIEDMAREYERRQSEAFAGVNRREFDINYQLLQFWDILSLALCTGEPREQTLELVPDSYSRAYADGVAIRMTPLGGGEIRLDPSPFDTPRLEVAVTYRLLPTHDYPGETEFRLAWFGAAPMVRKFTFV